MIGDDYGKARKAGEQAFQSALREGRYPYLPVLDQFLDESKCSRVHLGTIEIPLSQVIGTKTEGRTRTFACNFMPVMDKESEFGVKWSRLYESQVAEGMRDPVIVYEYLHYFYVQEGNKRVSVAKYLNMPTVNAQVTRLTAPDENPGETDLYEEFLKFYAVCPLYELNFTKKGSYLKFAKILGRDLKTPWDEVTVSRVKAAFYNFHNAYAQMQEVSGFANESDALLTYLSVYEFDKLRWQSVQTVRKNIARLRKEMIAQSADDHIELRETPPQKKESPLPIPLPIPLPDIRKIIPAYTESKPLKIAFIYDNDPEKSAWTYEHEVGRLYLNKKFRGIVKADCYSNCNTDEKIMDALNRASEDSEMIFTVSPSMMNQTLKAAIQHPDVQFLNCSVNLSSKAVRSYYVRMYEVKFLMGALAAMHAENHRVCYVADYPIYGSIASINAFAIGASFIDPEIRVYLAWSGVYDQDWFRELDYLDINVFCGPDVVKVKDDRSICGLCRRKTDGSLTNLAMPVINWANYYEKLITPALEGAGTKDSSGAAKAVNYWWGIDAGAVDLNISSAVSYSSAKMIRLMKENLTAGTFAPFFGELRTQKGVIRTDGDGKLSQEEIIRMDWLNENVIGVIPEYESIRESAKKLVSVSGVGSAKEKV